jgi:phage terminase Nu1 subunit (DNA packaging protein)
MGEQLELIGGPTDTSAGSTAKRLVNRWVLAERLGCNPQTLYKWADAGMPVAVRGRSGRCSLYDEDAVQAWLSERQAGRTRPGLDLAAERAKLTRVQTEVAALKLRAARGDFISSQDADRALRAMATAARAALLAVSARAVLSGVPPEYEATINRLIVESLRELSEARTIRELAAVGYQEQETLA